MATTAVHRHQVPEAGKQVPRRGYPKVGRSAISVLPKRLAGSGFDESRVGGCTNATTACVSSCSDQPIARKMLGNGGFDGRTEVRRFKTCLGGPKLARLRVKLVMQQIVSNCAPPAAVQTTLFVETAVKIIRKKKCITSGAACCCPT